MDRYNDVKILLKKWEQSFFQTNSRKPNKDDIDKAPEETRQLYKEYRSLKEAKERKSSEQDDQTKPPDESHSSTAGSGCWGSHLNRKNMPAAVPKLSSDDKETLKASAQYFGMKLKNNLGALTKERSFSLKKATTPRRTPTKPLQDTPNSSAALTDVETHTPKSANTRPDPSAPPVQTASTEVEDEPSDPFPSVTPSKSWSPAVGSAHKSMERVQYLRQSMTKRISSVDSGWLARCQVFDEVEEPQKPVAGNSELTINENSCLSPTVRSETVLNQGQTSPKTSLKKSKSSLSEDGAQKSPVASSVRDIVLLDATLGSPGPHGEQVYQKDTAALTGDDEMCSEEPKSPVKAKKRKPRARKDQDLGEKPQAEGGKKTKGRKRQREGDDVDESEEQEGGVKKRRRTKKGEAAGEDQPKKGGKRKGKVNEEEEDDDVSSEKKKTQKQAIPQENLLGEVDEVEARAAAYTMKNTARARPTKNTDGNFVKINLKKKSHVKGFALRGAALRKQMYMQKFQLKGERFGGGFGRGRGRFGGFNRQGDTCYKCGGTGHWARDCRGKAPVVSSAEQQETPGEEEEFELPTLEEVARATGTLRSEPIVAPPCVGGDSSEKEEQGEEILLNIIRPDYERPAPPPPMEPLYTLKDDGKVQDVPPEVYEALRDFGYKSFRPGQETAIMRILSGLSTLVVLSTGMGKSLCYQLPAYLYAQRSKCITLVVSPLVSLMDDQLSGLPPKLKAACIHSNMSQKQREAAIEKVKAGQVHVLLLSPEALVGGGHSGSGCLPPADQLPPVAFACIDEAHCVSEWSHNFRPCYLRLCKVLRDRLGVRCLLGLTATATLSTALDIARHLDISDQDGIAVRSAAVPHNLQLSVSMDRDKDQALVSLLKGERFGALESVIVYCTRREETSRISALLRTCLQGVMLKESSKPAPEDEEDNPVGKKKKALARKKIRKPLKWIAEAYHAGMSASERRRVQNNFMCGELRVVVATVAFGMGLDKSDVRGIIHYNMPKSFESYVQEIGRAGRDGHPAHCHLFLDPEGADLHELRRHIYADTVDYYTVKKLVQKVFPPCKCRQIQQKQQDLAQAAEVSDSELLEMEVCEDTDSHQQQQRSETVTPTEQQPSESNTPHEHNKSAQTAEEEPQESDGGVKLSDECVQRACHTHERAIPMQETVEALDITEESLETLLCYLELHPQQWVELLHPTLSVCKLQCYGGPQQLRKITKLCPPVAVALARKRMAGECVESCDALEFDVVELADTMGWQLPLVKRGLRQLQWGSGSYGGTGRSGVHVEFSALSFYFRSYGDLTPDELDAVGAFLHGRVMAQERTQLYQLKTCFKAFRSVAYRNCSLCMDDLEESRSQALKELLRDYFDKRRNLDLSKHYQEEEDEEEELNKCKMRDWEGQICADIRSFLSSRSDEKFSGRAVARIFHGIGSPCYPAQTYGRDRRYWRKYIQFDFNEIIRLATQEIIRTR
ncbi:ATP-dependent DNA helicase Q4 [Megalobrama amblycephala]|uniref:ATP-dependent DNA helicase Q4 n=1 Tax=Megalobrama amblycephala TaxID=75352 RepID=UPI002013C8CE|nr:ATP-dependent DNA helicase Q4 [Megalobrama amblycephala]XP_048059462.1 ATP-dependent DNA helicase Q4 [Megalobrama amblycephala]